MALVTPDQIADPVEAATETIMGGPPKPEDAEDVPDDASPTRQRGDVTVDLTGGRHRFCDDDDAKRIADAWTNAESDPTHVTSLDLSLNKLSDEGAGLIIDAIAARPCRLANIDLDGNGLTDETLRALAEKLLGGDKTSLKRFDLSSNRITDDGVAKLVEACAGGKNTTLHAVHLRANAITNSGALRVCSWLEAADCQLRTVHLSGNEFTDAILRDVGEALKTNANLTDLNLNNSMAKVSDLTPLVESAKDHPSLLVLPLAFDGKSRTSEPVKDMIRRNKAEVKSRQDLVVQLRAAHAAEVGALKQRIAELEAEVQGYRDGGAPTASNALGQMSSLLSSPREGDDTQ